MCYGLPKNIPVNRNIAPAEDSNKMLKVRDVMSHVPRLMRYDHIRETELSAVRTR